MYKLTKPYTEEQRLNFIFVCSHKNSLSIEEGKQALYA